MQIVKRGLAVGLAGFLAVLPMAASAQVTFDTAEATSALTAGLTAIAAIGVAALVMVVVAKVWKRLRGVA